MAGEGARQATRKEIRKALDETRTRERAEQVKLAETLMQKKENQRNFLRGLLFTANKHAKLAEPLPPRPEKLTEILPAKKRAERLEKKRARFEETLELMDKTAEEIKAVKRKEAFRNLQSVFAMLKALPREKREMLSQRDMDLISQIQLLLQAQEKEYKPRRDETLKKLMSQFSASVMSKIKRK